MLKKVNEQSIQNGVDMFPHTDKAAKWQSISFRIPRGGLDVLPILSCHVETVAQLSLKKRYPKNQRDNGAG